MPTCRSANRQSVGILHKFILLSNLNLFKLGYAARLSLVKLPPENQVAEGLAEGNKFRFPNLGRGISQQNFGVDLMAQVRV